MADVIMKLAEFHTPGNNFSIFNFTEARLGEHERNSFLIGNNCEMASFNKAQPFAYCLDYGSRFLLESGIPLFTCRKSSQLDDYLVTTQQPAQSRMHPSRL